MSNYTWIVYSNAGEFKRVVTDSLKLDEAEFNLLISLLDEPTAHHFFALAVDGKRPVAAAFETGVNLLVTRGLRARGRD